MSLFTTLSIARQSLYVNQLGLQVTSQNVANVNTQGYKRQRVNQANLPYGLGVTVQSIQRQLNPFAEKRILRVTSDATNAADKAIAYNELEGLFNEMSGSGLEHEFEEFFISLHDLADGPGGSPQRATVRSRGNSLADVFNFYYQQMEEQMDAQEIMIENQVREVNKLTQDIAQLNRQIAESIQNRIGINELRNDRDEAVRKLSEILPVNVSEDAKGNFALYIQNGMPLVAGVYAYGFELESDPTNGNKNALFWKTDTGTRQELTEQITGGALGAALEIRDDIMPRQMAKMDRLVAEFVAIFNEQHRQGRGLDGVTGRNFFEPTPVFSAAGRGTEGGGCVTSAVVVDETLTTLNDYEVRFVTDTDYEVVNTTTGAVLDSGVYASGMTLAFDGLEVTLSDVTGPPQEDDFFRINTYGEAAKNMALAADVVNSTDAIAAGFTDGTGDNQNALQLADLESRRIARDGTMNFREVYQSILVELGVDSAAQYLENESTETILSQTSNLIESASGVNTDEEATVLMAFQRAYQASAKVVNTTDEMMETMLTLVQ